MEQASSIGAYTPHGMNRWHPLPARIVPLHEEN